VQYDLLSLVVDTNPLCHRVTCVACSARVVQVLSQIELAWRGRQACDVIDSRPDMSRKWISPLIDEGPPISLLGSHPNFCYPSKFGTGQTARPTPDRIIPDFRILWSLILLNHYHLRVQNGNILLASVYPCVGTFAYKLWYADTSL